MSGALLRNLLLLLVLIVLVAAHWALPSDQTKRNFYFMPNMVDSPAYEAQAPTPFVDTEFSIDLRPPDGSVARGHEDLLFEPTSEDALRAGQELENPIAADDAAAVARGAVVFQNFCVTCHGGTGGGDGPVAKKGVPPPPSIVAGRALEMADGQMYHIISFGQGNMASYASQVERNDRWRVIKYVRQLQGEATP